MVVHEETMAETAWLVYQLFKEEISVVDEKEARINMQIVDSLQALKEQEYLG